MKALGFAGSFLADLSPETQLNRLEKHFGDAAACACSKSWAS
jgi:hypothetical protein